MTRTIQVLLIMSLGVLVPVAVAQPKPAQPAAKPGAVTLEVMNPRGEIPPPPFFAPAKRTGDLPGKKIGLYWIGKAGGNNFFDVLEQLLKEKYPSATILRYRGPFDLGEKRAAEIAKEVDTFVYGVGD
jgi:hypothetical protein